MGQSNILKCEICGENSDVEVGLIKGGSFKRIGFCDLHKRKYQFKKSKGLSSEKISIDDIDESIKCSSCGMKFKDYCSTGQEQCDKCFDEFYPKIAEIIKKSMGVDHNISDDVDSDAPKKENSEIENLKSLLDDAIKSEDYDKAAEIRDKIKEKENDAHM